MTEKERSEQRDLIEDILGKFVERIDGRFNVMFVELTVIKELQIKTNDTVKKHDAEIKNLEMADMQYEQNERNYPKAEDIRELIEIRKRWKYYAISSLVIGFMSIASVVTVYESVRALYRKDVQQVEQAVKTIQKETKVQDEKIDNNKNAINDQAVEQAFQNSLDKE